MSFIYFLLPNAILIFVYMMAVTPTHSTVFLYIFTYLQHTGLRKEKLVIETAISVSNFSNTYTYLAYFTSPYTAVCQN